MSPLPIQCTRISELLESPVTECCATCILDGSILHLWVKGQLLTACCRHVAYFRHKRATDDYNTFGPDEPPGGE